MVDLHPDERAVYEAALVRRAHHLAQLLDAGVFSPSLLGLFVGQILRAAVPLCGDGLRADLFSWLGRQVRESYGLCPFCGAGKTSGDLLCSTCVADMRRIDGELETLEAATRADGEGQ